MVARKKLRDIPSIGSRAKVDLQVDGQATNLRVGVRVRPILHHGVRASEAHQKDILRVQEGKRVVVLDPDEDKAYLDIAQGRTKERTFTFDAAFGQQSTNQDVYDTVIKDMCLGCMSGHNVTVFAYGATGSGKTYTMVGTRGDPGLMVLSLEEVFRAREGLMATEDINLTCSYIEVYNEVVYDLLVERSAPLDLREDPKQGVCVAGVKRHSVSTPTEIMSLLQEGNGRRKTDSTGANATSSRSHAVLEIRVSSRRKGPKGKGKEQHGKLCLVDLAGSERAAETDNRGQKLRDGANINKSLLALANCINALGKASSDKGGKAYVPYRNSKLTRLLKDGLGGNSRTAMIATVSASADQYLNSINTLKYADRAKEIKTHVKKSGRARTITPAESPSVANYQKIIVKLQTEVQDLREQLEVMQLEAALPVPRASNLHRAGEAERMRWLTKMGADVHDVTEEYINLQKAQLEVEDTIVCNKVELKQLKELVKAGGLSKEENHIAQERIVALMGSINDNEKEMESIKWELVGNEAQREDLQKEINEAMESNSDTVFLQVVMSYRMQAVKLQELQFQSAVRDQVITEQRGVIDNLWRVIEGAGISKEEVERIGRKRGVLIEGLAGWPSGTRQKGTRPGTTSTGGVLGGLFRTIRGAGNRAHLRYDFWRRKERGEPIEEDEGEADDDERSALGDTAHGHGILGGIIQTIKNKFFGTKAGKPVKGEQAVSTFKVAVAPAPAPLPQLPSPKF